MIHKEQPFKYSSLDTQKNLTTTLGIQTSMQLDKRVRKNSNTTSPKQASQKSTVRNTKEPNKQ